jgi:endonuclease/exonuclease/phosphatase family metal-dependent hydrolase
MKVFFSNIGYAKAMDGGLKSHLLHAYRHVYCPPKVQHQALDQLKTLIDRETPDVCCLLEIDSGSFYSSYINQISRLMDGNYPFHDISDKYGNILGKLPLHKGKSNAFMAKKKLPFERRYFASGSKRLVYRVQLENIALYFAHFSLRANTRQKQFTEIRKWMVAETGEVILLGDFNVLNGLQELDGLLQDTNYVLLNDKTETTFTFHKRRLLLDICICTPKIAKSAKLQIIPQPFSDHSALLLDIDAVHFGN